MFCDCTRKTHGLLKPLFTKPPFGSPQYPQASASRRSGDNASRETSEGGGLRGFGSYGSCLVSVFLLFLFTRKLMSRFVLQDDFFAFAENILDPPHV